MADRKDVLLVQIVHAFTQGFNGTEISDDVAGWFHGRYYDWIDTKKAHPDANGTSPLDVWDTQGKKFLGKFREIGQAVSGGTMTAAMLQGAAETIEKASDCPWCPIQP